MRGAPFAAAAAAAAGDCSHTLDGSGFGAGRMVRMSGVGVLLCAALC